LVVAVFATAVLSAVAFAASSARPTLGHYVGTTSEHWAVKFKVADHGETVIRFRTVDWDNGRCHWKTPAHVFHYTVSVPLMKVKSSGSFSRTVKSTLVPGPNGLWGRFRVKGRFSSGKARGTVTRLGQHGRPMTCGRGASNPNTPLYLETFSAKRP
jgi:hypothetical protein